MTHIELMEPRRLMAVAGVDTTFADHGGLKLPGDYQLKNVLATNGRLFVDAYSPAVNGRYLLKYAASGELQTNWGRRGRVSLPVLSNANYSQSILAYDAHSAGVYIGDKPNVSPAASVNVQRVTNTGQIDSTYGINGIYTFAERSTLQAIVPLTHYQAMIAVDRNVPDPTLDPYSDYNRYTTQLDLIRLTAYGQRDSTFGRRGIVTVSGGAFSSYYGDGGGSETSEHSTFADLQLRSDGGYRVLSLRNNHYYREIFHGSDGATIESGSTDRVTLDSQVLTRRGVVSPALTQNYGVSSTKITQSVSDREPGIYKPILAKAAGDGAIVIGGQGTRKLFGGTYIGTDYQQAPIYKNITVLRFAGGKRTLDVPQLVGNGIASYASSGDGDLVVRTGNVLQRIDSSFQLDPKWGGIGYVPVDNATEPLTIDDEGRLLATRYENLIRIDG